MDQDTGIFRARLGDVALADAPGALHGLLTQILRRAKECPSGVGCTRSAGLVEA